MDELVDVLRAYLSPLPRGGRVGTKLCLIAYGLLVMLVGGVLDILNCSTFRWGLQPCESAPVYAKELSYMVGGIWIIGLVMVILGIVLSSKPVRDDYKSPLGTI